MDVFRICSVCFAISAALAAAVLVSLASLSLEEAQPLPDRRDLVGDTTSKLAKSLDTCSLKCVAAALYISRSSGRTGVFFFLE